MKVTRLIRQFVQAGIIASLGLLCALPSTASAINPLPIPDPKTSSYGVEATKLQPPPKIPAKITVPGNGASFSTSPINVSGICTTDLLVQVYDNGVMVGSAMCKGGSFSVQITLFSGQNELTATVFDSLDQAGPESNKVTVTYNNTNFAPFGVIMTLTSNYGRRAANPGTELNWPLQLSGGTGPYAFSIDWGDGTPSELKSQTVAGVVNIKHTYKKAGIYQVVVKVTDVNGVSAFLQLVAVANGQVTTTDTKAIPTKTVTVTRIIWIPVAIAFAMLFPTYWLGRRSQLISLHKRMQKSVENYKEL